MTGFGQGYGEMDGQLLRNDDIFRAQKGLNEGVSCAISTLTVPGQKGNEKGKGKGKGKGGKGKGKKGGKGMRKGQL